MAAEKKRGSNGGNALAEKLTKEQRSAIATAAAQRRWAKKNGTDVEKLVVKITDPPFTLSGSTVQPAIIYEPVAAPIIHEPPKEFHCPACIGGNPLEHGLHIAGTIEHPFTPVPAQIVDSPPVFVEPAPAPPQKPVSRSSGPGGKARRILPVLVPGNGGILLSPQHSGSTVLPSRSAAQSPFSPEPVPAGG